MGRLSESFEFGADESIDAASLLEVLKKMYRVLSREINSKPAIYTANDAGVPRDGATTDTFASLGDITINTSTQKIEMLVEHTDSTTVVWKEI